LMGHKLREKQEQTDHSPGHASSAGSKNK